MNLTEQERGAMIALDQDILRAKAAVLDAKDAVQQAEQKFLGALTVLAQVHGITGQVRLSPDGSQLVEVGQG